MNLYHLTQDVFTGFGNYIGCIVAAESEEEARLIRPDGESWEDDDFLSVWPGDPDDVKVKLIGKAAKGTEAGVILASYMG